MTFPPIQVLIYLFHRARFAAAALYIAAVRRVLFFCVGQLDRFAQNVPIRAGVYYNFRRITLERPRSVGTMRRFGVKLVDLLVLNPKDVLRAAWAELRHIRQKRAAARVLSIPVSSWTPEHRAVMVREVARVTARERL